LFIINPLSVKIMDNLFSTHPSPEDRIERLQAMAREMGHGPGATATRSRSGSGSVPSVGNGGPWG
jgi:heat shock protein HtpX